MREGKGGNEVPRNCEKNYEEDVNGGFEGNRMGWTSISPWVSLGSNIRIQIKNLFSEVIVAKVERLSSTKNLTIHFFAGVKFVF